MADTFVSRMWINHPPPACSPYWERVRFVAKELHSDGCSGVPDFYVDACFEHDIHWRTGCTLDGETITTAQANTRFRRVIQSRSKMGILSPLSWWRWAGVSIGAKFLKHQSV